MELVPINVKTSWAGLGVSGCLNSVSSQLASTKHDGCFVGLN